jgi:hypothetical protein
MPMRQTGDAYTGNDSTATDRLCNPLSLAVCTSHGVAIDLSPGVERSGTLVNEKKAPEL